MKCEKRRTTCSATDTSKSFDSGSRALRDAREKKSGRTFTKSEQNLEETDKPRDYFSRAISRLGFLTQPSPVVSLSLLPRSNDRRVLIGTELYGRRTGG